MKFISEMTQNIEVLTEATKTGEKAMYITGPFMEAETVNGNGRKYPMEVMREAVNAYVSKKVSRNCAYGELNHPEGPQINLERACILIKSLDLREDGQVIGKARITETPMGKIVKGLIESGASLGVSSRGMGSIVEKNGIKEVQNDFRLVTASDVVADPSAPNAYVQGIMENVDWVFNESTGEWAEATRKILKKKNMRQIAEAQTALFDQFLKSL
jgi:hypothetical protein